MGGGCFNTGPARRHPTVHSKISSPLSSRKIAIASPYTMAASIPSRNRVEPGSVNVPAGNFPATSTSLSVDPNEVASNIIHQFNNALSKKDHQAISNLFLENGYWRDHLCVSWDFRTINGSEKIANFIQGSKLTQIDIDRSSASRAPRVGPVDCFGDVIGIEFFTNVSTEVGSGRGITRLLERDGQWKIFAVFSSLQELKGHEEGLRHRRPKGVEHGQHQESLNWKDRRIADVNYENKDPAVVIIGMYPPVFQELTANDTRRWPGWSDSSCQTQDAQCRHTCD